MYENVPLPWEFGHSFQAHNDTLLEAMDTPRFTATQSAIYTYLIARHAMKTDLYTKVILTLIALFLGVLSFDKVYEAAIPEAQANEPKTQAKRYKWECFTGRLHMAYDFANINNFSFMTMSYNLREDKLEFCGYW